MKKHVIHTIKKRAARGNLDNISRTVLYEQFYMKHPEIKWALLAGLVSRNAGWNMTDLWSKWFHVLISTEERNLLFSTYERANWTIFADAYPQLLWYERAKKKRRPDYSLLAALGASQFMQNEWRRFWEKRDEQRLCTALIINEQFVIEEPVLRKPPYQNRVFATALYAAEEHAHFSYVLFPTKSGNLYGLYTRDFRDVHKRIWLGKQLAKLLFHQQIHAEIIQFLRDTPPTGSRHDYSQYMDWSFSNTSPALRGTVPLVAHHWSNRKDWYLRTDENVMALFAEEEKIEPVERTNWLQMKMGELYLLMKVKQLLRG
ncbi:DUF2515 domain-containing protein [Alkalihalobacillus oceani]|uniref:DUF2515 domain-containing protein n=1 Tax=Halalkalibacter oceani TaxID=1653776 RepID=A0A9X2DMI7_9BACI|nr:DUF2515 family protein [Halalkalibacter oceani]MCM3713544.1 DUF2515 domain-containing protein [Halalkalibacter oceani]